MVKRSTITVFLITETVLYVLFMAMDLFSIGGYTIGLKYAGILLCLLFCVLCAAGGGDRILPFALLFTAVADFFLLVINEYYLAGVCSFILVQTLYLIRLYRGTGKLWLTARIICAVLAVLVLMLTGLLSAVNLASVLYYSLLLINMVLCWTLPGRKWRTFALGLTLFILCDTCVGIFNMGSLMPSGLYAFASIGMWLFYLPSQVLISLTALNPQTASTK